jgi:hypothetical protein
VDRSSGIVEFPNFSQFERIARQEKVPSAEVEKAFGHMRKGGRKKTSRRRRKTSRPATQARPWWAPGTSTSTLAMNAGRRKRVRRDDVYVPATRTGEEQPMTAVTAAVPDGQVGTFGAERGILTTSAGQTFLLPYEQAFQILAPWLTKTEFQTAFGHVRRPGVLGATERRRPIPTTYGPRSMRLGHREPPGEGPPLPGIVKGQLVLYHKPTGSIVWQAYDDEVNFPEKPLWIWFGANKIHVGFPKAMQGARAGTGERSAMIGAIDRGIPAMAMLQAFDLLLTPDQRKEAYEVFAQR